MVTIWPFSRKTTKPTIDAQELVAQLLHRLDEQDRQVYQLQCKIEDQTKQIEKMIRRVDQATGRGVA